MNNNARVCIFVDGENFRHSIVELLPDFDRRDHLPEADWAKFYDWIAIQVAGEQATRVRTYWYVVNDIDFSPHNLRKSRKDPAILEGILMRDPPTATLITASLPNDRQRVVMSQGDKLKQEQEKMEERFRSWRAIYDGITRRNKSIEFRRAGAIRYDLFTGQFGSEKAVDVKLATDLIRLKDIYDIAVIVSGDQDYVPAVDAIKDSGKHTVNVAFKTAQDRLLPGGARRLNQSTDWCLEVQHPDLMRMLG